MTKYEQMKQEIKQELDAERLKRVGNTTMIILIAGLIVSISFLIIDDGERVGSWIYAGFMVVLSSVYFLAMYLDRKQKRVAK